ncbi:MAG TPA: Gfo/Idh/MocA family oxidoreductase [Bacillota bacterium]|nr:Gfo/Idh/MocA family oxidoreductase [Bacillota bacterium]
MKKITAILIGAGNRGMDCLAPYALRNPLELQFTAVAEPVRERREAFGERYNVSRDRCFGDWEELLDQPKLADAAIICTGDRLHFAPAVKALEKGYHVLLEKPMATTPEECITLRETAAKYGRFVVVCHVLRYTSFFSKLKALIDDGVIGRLIAVSHNENIGYYHFAHSYVRGNWRNEKEASPIILAKCCHDLDIMLWLAGADCFKLSSFGELTHFKSENSPEGAPAKCLDGCPAQADCPYYAPKIYFTAGNEWLASVISMDRSREALMKALNEGPYGRCVYHCDNDVPDHQVVNIEFANGVTASFMMSAFTREVSRTLKLMGTMGEIRGSFEKNEIEIMNFNRGPREVIYLDKAAYGHGGGDDQLMREFVGLLQPESDWEALTSVSVSVQSHLMAFAAEKSRRENRVVYLKEFEKSLKPF